MKPQNMVSSPIFRFAPSPNGWLHLGHAYSAIRNYELAKANAGRFLVRIEDIDVGRARQQYVDAIFEDLEWLGLSWETPVVHQSQRFDFYGKAIERLKELGVLYPCYATRQEISAAVDKTAGRDPDGAPLYPGALAVLSKEEIATRQEKKMAHTLRLDMAAAISLVNDKLKGAPLSYTEWDGNDAYQRKRVEPQRWGDVVIVRKEIPTSYHLAVVLDDAAQDVTHIVRGQDLLAATDVHRVLQVLLDLPEPIYHHHGLIKQPEGEKLSKSKDALSLRKLREDGVSSKELRADFEGFLASYGFIFSG